MAHLFRYSEWDGTQDIPPLDPDDILAGLTDDLLTFADLPHPLPNLLQRGLRNPLGQRLEGLRDLLQQLRQQRRQQLDRYNLSSVFDDIQKKLDEIMSLERETVDRRLQEANQQLEGGERPLQGCEEAVKPSGQEQTAEEQKQLAEMLKSVAERKKNTLDSLPEDAGGRIKELQNYEFMDPEAGAKFQELMEMLKKALMDTFFKDLYQQIADMGPEEMARMKEMLRDLNAMLSEKMAGGEPDFQGFMQKYGDLFGDNPPQSLDELIEQMQQGVAAMQSLLDSLPSDMRQQLHDLLMDKIGDPDLQRELMELQMNLDIVAPGDDLENQYPFRGDEGLDLLQAMKLMDNLQDMDDLEKQLEKTQYGGIRDGPQVPVHLTKDDFQVYRSEQLTTTATVLMLDLSWSMALRGSFQAAKKVALALHNLIRTQFPKDSLYLIGFSAYARELKPDELPYVRWDESVLGTNMHHALMMAQKMLAKHSAGTKQVIMISDGEPTAHLEHGRSYFAYPPSPITIRETLKEVRRCTQKDIVINTFMLDRNYYLKEFVNQIARMNKGRVFYTTPERLGQYILVDYVSQKRKRFGNRAA